MTNDQRMTVATIVEQLAVERRRFGRGPARRKGSLLRRAAQAPLDDAATLLVYHEALLFLLAYPDDDAVRRLAEGELKRCAAAARRLVGSGRRRETRRLEESGLAHTRTTCTYSIDTATWLAARFGGAVELAWEDESLGSALDEFLPVLASRVEGDGTLHRGLSTLEWFRLARGADGGTDLAWLLRAMRNVAGPGPALDCLYDTLDLKLAWRLSAPVASRTFQRFPPRRRHWQTVPVQRDVDLVGIVDDPVPAVRPLPVREGERLIDVGRSVLCVRHRETDPMTYASPREVYLVRLERGFDVAVFGMQPERRLPIESFFGYVAARNRIPLAYGGGWVFLDRCEIGINVFDTFRGGESAWAFAQICRVYRQLFRSRRFTVDPYQFGADNPEAIRSGAFWFYYRLGFRPTDPKLRELADTEADRLARDRSHRTAPGTLRRLARGRLALILEEGDGAPPDLPDIGLAVTGWIGREHGGDRLAAERAAVTRVRRDLDVPRTANGPEPVARWFTQLSVLVAMAPELGRDGARDRRALVSLMRAKGGPRERDYALRLQRHASFRRALHAIAERAT